MAFRTGFLSANQGFVSTGTCAPGRGEVGSHAPRTPPIRIRTGARDLWPLTLFTTDS